ncbi:Fe-S cluster assembly protein SufD [Phormidesmis priestleyi]|uniref:Fe-S cluster assembly protein SufD n=1 Tax=Phormidesmis priestleyi TaxID=268141 RepID=UPI00083B5234|nr:Fe-S cluster assembly protein SufD [Phormidesmis priestleyi]
MTVEVSTSTDTTEPTLKARVDRSAYLAGLLKLRPELPEELAELQGVRDRALAIAQELAIPTTRDEEWRFTDLSSLVHIGFALPDRASISFAQIESFILPEAVNSRLVFVDGTYAPDLSATDDLPEGVLVTNLSVAVQFLPSLHNYLAKQQGAEEVFTALNTASLIDGAIVHVPKNQHVETPIQILFVSTAGVATIAHPRCLVIAESGSSLTLVEEFVSIADGGYFTNAVTEIAIAENAQVNHTRVQRESETAFHIGKTAVSQARDSRYSCSAISLGAKIARHNLEVYQTGEQTQTTLNGLTMINGEQVGDTHSKIAFTKPYGTSDQVQKCIVGDRAHAIFNGKVSVPQAAQLTNAAQLSRNLLLSPRARIDTKPQLEITADNVKCAHGATVSQLEDDEVFYLQSRGLNPEEARKLLTYAFAIEIINHIPVASLKANLTTIIRTQQL